MSLTRVAIQRARSPAVAIDVAATAFPLLVALAALAGSAISDGAVTLTMLSAP